MGMPGVDVLALAAWGGEGYLPMARTDFASQACTRGIDREDTGEDEEPEDWFDPGGTRRDSNSRTRRPRHVAAGSHEFPHAHQNLQNLLQVPKVSVNPTDPNETVGPECFRG